MAVVARTTSLADVLAFRLRCFADGLAIGDLRLAYIGFDFVLAHHAVDDDFQVQLAHAADDGLARVRIRVHLEGGIFLRQLRQRHAHLFLIGLGLRFHRDVDHRSRKVDRFQHNRRLISADGIAGDQILETYAGANVTGIDLDNLFPLVGMHLEQAADALAPAGTRIEHRVARLQVAGIEAHKDQLPDETGRS